jgi:hypothetical protein
MDMNNIKLTTNNTLCTGLLELVAQIKYQSISSNALQTGRDTMSFEIATLKSQFF